MPRGRLLFAVIAGLAFEFFHFFHYEARNLERTVQMLDGSGAGHPEVNSNRISYNSSSNNNIENDPPLAAAKDYKAFPRPEEQQQQQQQQSSDSLQQQQQHQQQQSPPEAEVVPDTPPDDARQVSMKAMSSDLAAMIALRAAGGPQRPPPPIPQGPPPPRPQRMFATTFEASKYDYRQPATPSEFTLPPPKITSQTTVVIVLSARQNFEARTAIRQTWANNQDNVYFVIGGPEPGNLQDMDLQNPQSTGSLLLEEQKQYGDMIDSILPDTYRSLPQKLHYGMKWVYNNVKNVEWVVKADDDHVVRPKRLQFFVLKTLNPTHPMVLGKIAIGARPHRQGKWAEDPHFKDSVYPPWPFGSAGYVVSRPIIQYLAETEDLYYYQGEDAGLGIWLDESPLQTTFVDTPELQKDEGCVDKLFVIGHDLKPQDIRNCFAQIGDEIPERKHIISFTAGRKDQHPGHIRNPN